MSGALVTTGPLPLPANLGSRAQGSIRRHLAVALGLSGVLVFGIGGWATFTQISGAIIAPGQLVVESDVKKVQHPTGGVVGELLVREGQAVTAGQVLIRLDQTQTRANLDIIIKALDELAARGARDEAERDGETTVMFPPELLAKIAEPTVARLIDGEARLFVLRVTARAGQKAQLRERVAQLGQEVAGLTQQASAKVREIALIQSELTGVRALYAKNLVPFSRVTLLERDGARLEGERGQLIAQTASARGKITETELQILQIDQELRTESGKDLAEIRGKRSELIEKRIAAEDQLKRIELRAPQDGTVHQLTVHTIGGLVTPNEPAMLIVPSADQLAVEARIQPQDIDNVRLDQKAMLRFSAFNQRTTPEVEGAVSRVSADVMTDPKAGTSYYTVRIRVLPDQLSRLGGARLVPGMPVESFVQLGDRSVLSYLTKPISDQIAKAWRER
ncbi:HlyD family type I secretion periplasmic adaptor subunit [Methylobacterium brachythecii]|uniref:Membrane fusion protein (MFP) family protein n=1 Tax=Methylobacterium brachythecii TaxID=1176177 RepID=A0A7W6AH92_9HYPH|nr:HlyD family type I secretion periplasmic adaptor subunit [Methylobacterium brachythecii]MBB3900961.1 HlyD family secretion protein [Methylobacterium brachythecii]GLS45262.1 HlyD family type I secretion periplasmic adaptor subunit [Methylobacterium brachythecii]